MRFAPTLLCIGCGFLIMQIFLGITGESGLSLGIGMTAIIIFIATFILSWVEYLEAIE